MNTPVPTTQNVFINDTSLVIKEYNGQRVVTFDNIDMVHKRPSGTARKRFNDNKAKFIENVDYFKLSQTSEKRTLGFTIPNRGITLITQTGYLMLVKSFTDDLAWTVQRELVNSYFTKPEYIAPLRPKTSHMVADIPKNKNHQQLITSLKGYISTLNVLLDEINVYREPQATDALKTVIRTIAERIDANAMVLSVEKYNVIKEP